MISEDVASGSLVHTNTKHTQFIFYSLSFVVDVIVMQILFASFKEQSTTLSRSCNASVLGMLVS